ncbi:hypothetical protein [Candidatus Viridilinea mediisalina]|uniref:Lipoprotein n=1 Tax=Candidatus Viridilinea mediisalina TaxID=2024553 RepID=A0A2A6RGE5_9CHLR|nr:hypothetical protein [Candidatus Viridilinea mediisalina]PDW01930.1 hypothetical protein CJ255_16565 [Candidatus Viridilinea mediisalina]
MLRLLLPLLLLLLSACAAASPPSAGVVASPTAKVVPRPAADAPVLLGDGVTPDLPEVAAERERRRAALQSAPFILLREGLDERADAAQRAVVDDVRHQQHTRTLTGQRLLTEVMHVAPPRPGDLPPNLVAQCPPDACLRVLLYVYPTNTTLSAFVDRRMQVLDLHAVAGGQPEIPEHLAALATAIAVASPVSQEELGVPPHAGMVLDYSAATKVNHVGTTCERSNHLCVSPVFTWGDEALWVVVDLTELRLVAATWTAQGQSAQRRAVSEATLQDAAVAPLCETPGHVAHGQWEASYLLTSSDGLEVREVRFAGQPLLRSVKIVDWHVGYAAPEDQRVGFSDAVGCPVFSAAAIIPYGLPEITPHADGSLELALTFRSPTWPQPCAYQYTFATHFGADGTLTLTGGNEGRGCGIAGTYHPVWRIEPVAPASLRVWDGHEATLLHEEGWQEWAAGGPHAFQLTGTGGTQTITPLWGDAELAYVYWTHAKPAEGQGDLPTIGTCCALDERQGPEQFIDGNALAEHPVIWYVPRMTNAERERCWADMELEDGVLRPLVWPCSAGVRVRGENPKNR